MITYSLTTSKGKLFLKPKSEFEIRSIKKVLGGYAFVVEMNSDFLKPLLPDS